MRIFGWFDEGMVAPDSIPVKRIAKLAKNQSTRLTLGQFDQILNKLNSYGNHFDIADLLEYKK